jgi:2-polyprenyl-3-methyl-5-hydroxy-6-metoxy-1,4-benzoquinol methylase
MTDTSDAAYADRLVGLQTARWKRFVPNPYRRFLRRAHLGRVLDVGCGIGRSLGYLDGNGVGVDHNQVAVEQCRARDFAAHVAGSWQPEAASFDSLLCSHVIEHLSPDDGAALLATYLGAVKPGGKVVVITPQERGQASDATHLRHVDEDALRSLAAALGLTDANYRSYPLPRWCGRWFVYNEHILMATVAR